MTTATQTVKERPIIFSGESVRAILEGRKTQTRRVMKPQPEPFGSDGGVLRPLITACPYGYIGDRLWVRETFANVNDGEFLFYQATDKATFDKGNDILGGGLKWSSPIHMPRAASRITLEVVSVQVERVQDISDMDITAEGITYPKVNDASAAICILRTEFRSLWDKINGKKHPWASNPWVWVVEFKTI